MSDTVRDVKVRWTSDTKNYEDGLKRVQGGHNALGTGLKAVSGALVSAGIAMTTAIATSIGLAKNAIAAADEALKVDKQLEAVLTSTGGAAGMTKDALNELASSLQKVSLFDDEAIKSGEALLLTFTNIGKDVFPATTQAMLDMSQAMGQDIKSSAIQLGKALNNPVQGITALSRVGVSFTEDQKNVIKSLTETGRVAEAQKLILAELAKEFGGSATAATQTFSGALTQVKNAFGDIMEGVGNKLIPLMMEFAKTIQEYLPEIEALFGEMGDVILNIMKQIGPPIMELIQIVLPEFLKIVRSILPVVEALLPPIIEIVAKLLPIFVKMIEPLMPILVKIIEAILPPMIRLLEEALIPLLNELIPIIELLAKGIELAMPIIKVAFEVAINFVIAIIKDVTNYIKMWRTVAEELISFFKNVFKGNWAAAWQDIKDIFGAVSTYFKDKMNIIKDTVVNGLDKITGGFYSKAVKWATEMWKGLIQGLKDGLTAAWSSVKGVFDSFIGKVKGVFGISSPSKVFTLIGKDIVAGFEDGLDGLVESNEKLLKNMKGFLEDFIEFTELLNSVSGDVYKHFIDGFKSFINSLQTLSVDLMKQFGGDLEKAEREIGDSLIIFLRFLEGLADRINEEFNPQTGGMFAITTNYFELLGDKLKSSFGALNDALKDVHLDSISRVFKELNEMFATLAQASENGQSFVPEFIINQLKSFIDQLIIFAGKLNELLYGTKNPTYGVVSQKTLIDTLAEALEGSFKRLNEAFKDISLDNVNKFMASLKQFIDYIMEVGSLNFAEIQKKFENVFSSIGTIFSSSTWTDTVTKLDSALKQWKETIIVNLEDSISAAKAKWIEFIDLINQKAEMMATTVTPKLLTASDTVRTTFTQDVEVIKNAWVNALDTISIAATSFETQIGSMLEFLKAVASGEGIDSSGIQKTFTMLSEYVAELTTQLYNSIFVPVLETFAEVLKEIPQTIFDTLVVMMNEMEDRIVKLVTDLAGTFEGAWTRALSTFIQTWGKALQESRKEAEGWANWFIGWVNKVVDYAVTAIQTLFNVMTQIMEVLNDYMDLLSMWLGSVDAMFSKLGQLAESLRRMMSFFMGRSWRDYYEDTDGDRYGGDENDDDYILPPYRPPSTTPPTTSSAGVATLDDVVRTLKEVGAGTPEEGIMGGSLGSENSVLQNVFSGLRNLFTGKTDLMTPINWFQYIDSDERDRRNRNRGTDEILPFENRVVIQNLQIVANDPDEMIRKLQTKTRLGYEVNYGY